MYFLAVKQFARALKNLDAIIEKAIAHAQKNKFDPNNFFGMRLYPNMLPFAAQIRIACDNAKAAASNLAGRENPKHEDNETSMDELRGRIAKCLAYLDTFSEADFANTKPDTIIRLPNPPGKGLPVTEYLICRQFPNFYFHVTTAYALLRAGGVEIGKTDYLGPLNLRDAP